MCKQYRYIFKCESWEIPRGFVDENETTLEAAKRELLEEAGIKTEKLTKLGSLRSSIGIIDEEVEIFLARNTIACKDIEIDEHEIIEVKKYPFEMALWLIKMSKIIDGLTVAAILKTKQYLDTEHLV